MECFAPRTSYLPLFTRAEATPLTLARIAPAGATAPDLRGLSYQGPSWYDRIRARSRGAIVSLTVVGLLMVGAGWFWVDYNQGLVDEQHKEARLAVKKGDYQTALECYQKSLALRERMFDRNGQVQDLIEQSRCLSARGRWDEAMARLQKASTFEASPDVSQAMAHIVQEKGLATLEQAEFELRAQSFDKARKLAESSLELLRKGDGTPAQQAGAHRVAALAWAWLGEEKKVKQHLKSAGNLEGDSSANRAAAAKVKEMAEGRRKEREVALKKSKERGAVVLAKAREQARAREREWASTRVSYYSERGRETTNRHSSPSTVGHRLPNSYYPNPPSPYTYGLPPADTPARVQGYPAIPTRVPSNTASIPLPRGIRFP